MRGGTEMLTAANTAEEIFAGVFPSLRLPLNLWMRSCWHFDVQDLASKETVEVEAPPIRSCTRSRRRWRRVSRCG